MQAIFLRDKFPILLTLLFGAASWLIIHINDRLLAAPIVRYSVNQKDISNGHELTYRVKNITRDKKLDDLTFLITKDYRDSLLNNGDSIYSSDVIYYSTIKVESTLDITENGPNFLQTHLSQLQPGAFFEITIRKKKDTEWPLRVSSSGTVYLSESSIQTFLVEHELGILSLIAITCILVLIVYTVFLKKGTCIENSQ